MWIKGIRPSIINTDCLRAIAIGGTDGFYLQAAYYNRSWIDTIIIDEFKTEDEAIAASDWIHLLLQGVIEQDVWEKGRKDAKFREKYLQK